MANEGSGRRGFLTGVIAAGSVVLGAVVAIPGAAYVLDPLRRGRRKGGWHRVAGLSAVAEDHPVSFPVVGDLEDAWTKAPKRRLGTVWLRREGDRVLAWTAECPHLGCKVNYDPGPKRFGCPCHDSSFSLSGEKLGGPAPRGMDPLEARVNNGAVEVRFARFRAQVPERQEVG